MKFIFLLYCCLSVSTLVRAQEKGYWRNLYHYIENTSVLEDNQEEGRAYYIPAKNISLNGSWRFFWADVPEGIPSGFFLEKFNDKSWNTIKVPSNWEMEGYGDKMFRNVSLSFKPDPPNVPREYNPTGIYRRTFSVPSTWKGLKIFLRLEKVASASFVWINGKEVGYNEGAQEPAEYDITKFLKSGNNTIAVAVLKYSDGYYLEDQDYWRLAGIFDDVLIYATPKTRLFDWQIITDLDKMYKDASLSINVDVKTYFKVPAGNFMVVSTLFDAEGNKVSELRSDQFNLTEKGNKIIRLSGQLANPKKWTSETPNLYRLELKLLNTEGKVMDYASVKIGFKKTEIIGEVFYLNGQPLKLNAINSHMQHPITSHVIDEATIRKDFEILKQFNFNAIRTSHYPPTNKYLELANEYGLFIIDEVGDESHATQWVSDKPEYTEMYKERANKMVLRDRNYPCILFWSAGNESGEGFNITEVIKEGKRLDPSRFWMYGGNAIKHPAEDIIGPRYPTPLELEVQFGVKSSNPDRRPSFMDEYLSVAGNGGGGMDEYWNVIYNYPRIIGGAIWDFVSPGLKEKVRSLSDASPNNVHAHIMGNAKLVKTDFGKSLDLNGHDQWVEIYRDSVLETYTDKLTLSCMVFPRKLVSSCGSFITKGSYQYGLQQRGKKEIEFYLYTDKTNVIKAELPENWEENWHHVAAVYDGKNMIIYIDGKEKTRGKASGAIPNFPFPVNIGRNAELHGQDTQVYICDAIMDNVGIFKEVIPIEDFQSSTSLSRKAALWLDFEKEVEQGNFYSYGIGARTYGCIWPDRRVQPEMWQMKKTVQPLSIKLLDAQLGIVEVWNRNHFLDASYYSTKWILEADGKVIDQGTLDLSIAPLSRKQVKVPYKKPVLEKGKEYFLKITSCLKRDELWAHAGHEVAWDQIKLPWHVPIDDLAPVLENAKIALENDDRLVVKGPDFEYVFDKKNGILCSINVKGKELLKEGLSMNVWRAPLANERDRWCARNAASPSWKEGYGNTIATEFYSVGIDDMNHILLNFDAKELFGKVIINVKDVNLYKTNKLESKDLYIEGIANNGFENNYEYVISGDGKIELNHTFIPNGLMPKWLPRVGLKMILNDSLNQVNWYGRGPQENYPDRSTGYAIGNYSSTVEDMYEPYLIPQDYGLRVDNRWVKVTNKIGEGILIKMGENFNFNIYPYSTDNLTKAMYTYQLKRSGGLTMNLDYATSGVGCTARSILNQYRVMPQKYTRKIIFELVGFQ
jgi:beta-galactosidase